ncbi:hypothetical protein ABI59_12340 [Acidobacteria bacterium Mor1]|nr:hypothetical protein ABI59_12340 [Acidobacteria bacterium Mor1]
MHLQQLAEADLRAKLTGPGLPLRVGPFAIRLGTDLPELVEPLRLLYADYEIADDPIEDFHVRAAPAPGFSRFGWAITTVDGRPRAKPFRRSVALPMLEWTLNWCVFTRPQHCLVLHAAVVEREGRALILSGAAGAGKSTLATALAVRGWRLLSDEVATFPGTRRDERSRRVIPVPLPISLKNESIQRMRAFGPELTMGPAVPGTRKGTVAHVSPPGDALPRSSEPAEPVGIIFPRYTPGAGCQFEEVPRGETLMRLADESFNYSVLGLDGFETLAEAVEPCRCIDLIYDDLETALTRLGEL